MPLPSRPFLLILLAGVVASPAFAQIPPDPVLAGYTRLYSGEPEEAQRYFQSLRGGNPRALPAWFGELFALQERVEVDESLGASFERGIGDLITEAEQRHSRSRTDAEAIFYLAQAHLLRSTYRVRYDKGIWGAARDAAKSKSFSEQYIKLYPNHGDAYLALGLYNYYVDIAPNFIKVLRVILFLPSGSRSDGLAQVERASREGSFFAPLAETVLADMLGLIEGRLADAIPIAERFVRRFPANAGGRFQLAGFYAHPTVEAYDRSAQQYTAVLDNAKGTSLQREADRQRATLGLANLRRTQWRLDEAIALLAPTIERRVEKPDWVMPTFLLRRGNYRNLLNDPAAAEDARRVVADPKMSEFHKDAQQQIAAIETARRTNESAIYASLIPGNRLVVERRWDEARKIYDQVNAMHPGDGQARYRLAYLEFARANYPGAASSLQAIVSSTAKMPNWLKAATLLNLAWTYDLTNRRADALKLYKRVVDDFEGESASGPARLGLIAPYRGPVTLK